MSDLRHWLITSTTYATWLPGDERGSVSTVNDFRPEDLVPSPPAHRVRHNVPGTEYDPPSVGLRRSAEKLLRGKPVRLTADQACVALEQFRATCVCRGWELLAAAVMSNHFHVVVAADGRVPSARILGDLKAYASRELNTRWAKPSSGTWWTDPDPAAL